MKKGFIMIPNEVFDNLDEAGLYTYAWLIRNSVVEDGRRVVKTSVRDMACMLNCSRMTVFRALSKIEGFVTIKRGKNQYEPTFIEIHDVTPNSAKGVTPNVTPNSRKGVTPKKHSKPLETKGVQSQDLFENGTPNVTPKMAEHGTPNVTAPVTAPRVYKNDNIIISCLNILIKNNKEKECIYFVNALERIGENANSMSDKSDAEAERLLPIFVKEYYNLMVETNKASMGKIKTAIINQRLQFLKARIKESGLINVLEVINKSTQSRFLNGGGNRGFVANFEWIMRPNNFPKVLEGTYDNRIINNNGYADRTNSTRTAAEQRAFDVAARIAELAAEDDANERLWQQR